MYKRQVRTGGKKLLRPLGQNPFITRPEQLDELFSLQVKSLAVRMENTGIKAVSYTHLPAGGPLPVKEAEDRRAAAAHAGSQRPSFLHSANNFPRCV